MRHRKSGRKLNRTSAHRKAMFSNMLASLFTHERIETTVPKAKELKPLADKMVTLGKRGDLHARRLAMQVVKDETAVAKLFNQLAPLNQERPGGYTRILRTRHRYGDCAPMAIIEMVERTPAEG